MFAPPALLFLMKQSQQIWYFVCKHAKYCLSLGTLVKRNKPPTSLCFPPSLSLSLSPAASPPSIEFLWSLFLVYLVRFLLLLGLGLGKGADGSGGSVGWWLRLTSKDKQTNICADNKLSEAQRKKWIKYNTRVFWQTISPEFQKVCKMEL